MIVPDFCPNCDKQVDTYDVQSVGTTLWKCKVCGHVCDQDFDDDEYDQDDCCPTCGGDGFVEYLEHPECWGEDCPSEANHLVHCPDCGGNG